MGCVDGKPFLTTINGMLEPWALRNSAWKKRIVLWLYERAAIDEASCLHVNSASELKSARAFGYKGLYASSQTASCCLTSRIRRCATVDVRRCFIWDGYIRRRGS